MYVHTKKRKYSSLTTNTITCSCTITLPNNNNNSILIKTKLLVTNLLSPLPTFLCPTARVGRKMHFLCDCFKELLGSSGYPQGLFSSQSSNEDKRFALIASWKHSRGGKPYRVLITSQQVSYSVDCVAFYLSAYMVGTVY